MTSKKYNIAKLDGKGSIFHHQQQKCNMDLENHQTIKPFIRFRLLFLLEKWNYSNNQEKNPPG